MPAKKPDGSRIAQEIAIGRADDYLAEILEAVVSRQDKGIVFLWKIVLPDLDLEVTEEDFTAGEAEDVEREVGIPWHAIKPAESAQVFVAVVTAALVNRKGMAVDDARQVARSLKSSDIANGIQPYQGVASSPPSEPDAA